MYSGMLGFVSERSLSGPAAVHASTPRASGRGWRVASQRGEAGVGCGKDARARPTTPTCPPGCITRPELSTRGPIATRATSTPAVRGRSTQSGALKEQLPGESCEHYPHDDGQDDPGTHKSDSDTSPIHLPPVRSIRAGQPEVESGALRGPRGLAHRSPTAYHSRDGHWVGPLRSSWRVDVSKTTRDETVIAATCSRRRMRLRRTSSPGRSWRSRDALTCTTRVRTEPA